MTEVEEYGTGWSVVSARPGCLNDHQAETWDFEATIRGITSRRQQRSARWAEITLILLS